MSAFCTSRTFMLPVSVSAFRGKADISDPGRPMSANDPKRTCGWASDVRRDFPFRTDPMVETVAVSDEGYLDVYAQDSCPSRRFASVASRNRFCDRNGASKSRHFAGAAPRCEYSSHRVSRRREGHRMAAGGGL